jgi:hypothetical protein
MPVAGRGRVGGGVSTVPLKDVYGLGQAGVALDGYDDATLIESALEVFCFMVRNAKPDEGSDDTTGRRANAGPGNRRAAGEAEGASEQSAGNYRSNTRDSEGAGSNEETENAAKSAAGQGAGYTAFSRVGTGVVNKLTLSVPVTHCNTDVVSGEPGVLQIHNRAFGGISMVEESSNSVPSGPISPHCAGSI